MDGGDPGWSGRTLITEVLRCKIEPAANYSRLATADALKRYRTGGEQTVTVQHVNVSQDGQQFNGSKSTVRFSNKTRAYRDLGFGADEIDQVDTFVDWRGLPIVHTAATGLGLTALDLVVWAKTSAGAGRLYRSQHKLLPLFKKGAAAHVNNISLRRRGRHRTNLWTYPNASSLGSDARKGLQDHPTVKPTAMLQDALIDMTNRGEIVLDPFLGSGSTLIAAENTGRVCRGIELDPLYVDVIIRRYEEKTGAAVILADTGETFEKVAARRRNDERDERH